MNSLDSILHKVSKPARYTGAEWNSVVKDWKATPIRVALCYPEIYEIGMSNLALPILYEILNNQPDALAERAYAPWIDMEAFLREQNISLFSLESKHPLREFDIIGFSLNYELTYTNVLNIIDLAQLPLFSSQRDDSHPLIIAGGSCALNPEPMADFIDLFVLGEGEEIILEVLKLLRAYRWNKGELLRQAARLDGIYIPAFYQVAYNKDNTINKIVPQIPEAKPRVRRRVVAKLPPPVTNPVVPYIQMIHDHGSVEIQRGCTQGCRFCQASMIYRPMRERSQEEITGAVDKLSECCGYNEISLLSLSTGDYPAIEELTTRLSHQHYGDNLSLSLPSLRLDASAVALMNSLPTQRKTTLTFAPEAGSERLRHVINKGISEETILQTLDVALDKGWANIKLYFMIGLPSETIDDIRSIIDLVTKIRRLGRKNKLHVSASILIPKPHTPCQWLGQEEEEQLLSKFEILKRGLRREQVRFSWSDTKSSHIEATLSRGDRRLGKVIHRAWQLGCKFDAWSEHFDYQKWLDAFKQSGIAPSFYANRERALDEILPWDHIDVGVTPEFLKREYYNMWQGKETPNCRYGKCYGCGLQRWQAICQDKYARELRDA